MALTETLKALREQQFNKLICAASNTNKSMIKNLAKLATMVGFSMVDVGLNAELINSAFEGINETNSPQKPMLMASVDVLEDKHFRKAKINYDKCGKCCVCAEKCPSGALIKKDDTPVIIRENCYGCMRCKICGAISYEKINNNDFGLLKDMQAVELHTGKATAEEVKTFLDKNIPKNIELISFSVELERFSRDELLDYVNELTKFCPTKPIIQIDGKSMSGNSDKKSSLATIYGANMLLENNIDAYVQLAGGVNFYTRILCRDLNVNVAGLGWGSYLRKLLSPYLRDNLDKAIVMAREVVF